jgi:hypothetical protein
LTLPLLPPLLLLLPVLLLVLLALVPAPLPGRMLGCLLLLPRLGWGVLLQLLGPTLRTQLLLPPAWWWGQGLLLLGRWGAWWGHLPPWPCLCAAWLLQGCTMGLPAPCLILQLMLLLLAGQSWVYATSSRAAPPAFASTILSTIPSVVALLCAGVGCSSSWWGRLKVAIRASRPKKFSWELHVHAWLLLVLLY